MRACRTAIPSTFMLLIALCVLQLPREAKAQYDSGCAADGCESYVSRLFQAVECECSNCSSSQQICSRDGCLDRKQTLTGDWRGSRPSLEEMGISFDASVTQFYQGVARGGLQQHFQYGGHGDYDLSFDFGKLCELDGLSLELGAEHRFGETVNRATGSVIPAALLPNLPDPDINDLALTKVVLKHELSGHLEIFFGKLDTLEFDTNAFADGNGRDRFFSTAFNYNPIATRTVPFSTLGAGFNVKNDVGQSLTFIVLNTEDTGTIIGINELFADGAALVAELRIPTDFFGRRGTQMFGGSWSSREFKSLQQDGRVTIPDIQIAEKEGSWALYWNFDQFLWEDPCDSTRGWGVFGRAGISDGNPNPIEWFLSFGVGGHSLLSGRPDDTFGIGWYYTGISDEFGPVVSSLLTDGQGVELYYNIAITEWFQVTPDLQIVEPNTIALDTAIIPGLRARVEF